MQLECEIQCILCVTRTTLIHFSHWIYSSFYHLLLVFLFAIERERERAKSITNNIKCCATLIRIMYLMYFNTLLEWNVFNQNNWLTLKIARRQCVRWSFNKDMFRFKGRLCADFHFRAYFGSFWLVLVVQNMKDG